MSSRMRPIFALAAIQVKSLFVGGYFCVSGPGAKATVVSFS